MEWRRPRPRPSAGAKLQAYACHSSSTGFSKTQLRIGERRSHHGLYESLKKKFQTVVGKRPRGRYDHLPVPVTRLDETAFVSKSAGENRSANHIAISIR
jgi:hypothetical protein